MCRRPLRARTQLEVAYRGWLFLFVRASRSVAAGAELCVRYPRAFWAGRAAALAAYAAADAAIAQGERDADARGAPKQQQQPGRVKRRRVDAAW